MSSRVGAPGTGDEASLVKQALAALRGLQGELDEVRARQTEPIAILGMGCRFPGGQNPEELWQLLLSGKDAISEVPKDRWDIDALYDPVVSSPGKVPSRRGGFLTGLDGMDAAFFGISPREAPHVDPRQRLMLEIAWEALEDAGIPPDSLARSRTGVFVATLTNDYDHLLFNDLRRAEIYSGAGTANSVVANRLSYFLNLQGPSVALDTACSGSLVAVHLACESLRSGESTLALAGGVSVNLMAKSNVFFARSGALSPGGLCRTFDAAADGIVRSDGAAVVVLKRLSEALHDGNTIQAVVRGSAVNHDGRSNGIMAPNGEAQRAVLSEAYRRAGVSPSAVQYIELHGTGTPLGDPIEAQALVDVLGSGRSTPCIVGSLKSNVGHSEAAAGAGGIVKTVLAMRHGKIPPTANFHTLNPLIPFAGTAFRVAQEVEPWPAANTDESGKTPYLAGVSGFGFGGTNAHVVLESAPVVAEPAVTQGRPAFVLPISTATPTALAELAMRTAECLVQSTAATGALCRSAAVGRMHFSSRFAAVGATREDLAGALRSAAATTPSGQGKLAFVFSGQGSHWPGMGRQLYAHEPVFRAVLDRCEALIRQQCGWSLLEAMQELKGNDTEVVQPAIFGMQAALCELWRSWGVTPDYVVGHSLGEAAAAYCAEILSLEDALRVVLVRSRLMKRTAGRGKTAVVGMALQDAEQAICESRMEAFAKDLAVAGTNSPTASVFSGTPEAIDELLREMGRREIFCREVAGVDIAFHSPQMEPLRKELRALLADLRPGAASIPIISTVTGELQAGEDFDAAYWGRNLRDPFLFTQATEELLARGCDSFVEVSPHPVLSSSLLQTARARGVSSVVVRPSLHKGRENELLAMYETLGGLYVQGMQVNWKAVYPEGGPCAALPHYPWQRKRFWFDQLDSAFAAEVGILQAPSPPSPLPGGHPLLGSRVDAAQSSPGLKTTLWQNRCSDRMPYYLADHRVQGAVMMPGAAWLEMAREAGEQVFGGLVEVSAVSFEAPLHLGREPRELQSVLTWQGEQGRLEIFSRAGQEAWVRHVQSAVNLLPKAFTAANGEVTDELDRARLRCTRVVTEEGHYADLLEKGLEYGSAFRLLTGITGGASEAVATICLPEELSLAEYRFHPAMLDAALQLAAVAQEKSEHSYLPVGVGRFVAFSRVTQPVECLVTLRGQSGDARLEADLLLRDAAGSVVARLEGLVLQRLGPKRAVGLDWKSALIGETWVKQVRPAGQPSGRGKWLVFAGDAADSVANQLASQVAGQLEQRGQSAVIVRRGAAFRRVSENSVEISADLSSDVARLLGEESSWSGAVLLPNASSLPASSDDLAGCELALIVAQELVKSGSGAVLRLVTRGGQAVQGGDVDPWQAPVAGFALAVSLEHPELQACLIDLAPEHSEDEAAELAEEILAGGDEVRVAFRGGQRFFSRIEPVTFNPSGGPDLRADATYLITGGLGNLGLRTAERMVRDGARYLVLTSRKAVDSAATEALRAMGAQVVVAACDLAQEDEVNCLFDQTLAALPPLRGVIHAAGVVEDALLLRQTVEGFRRVMAAKVHGSWNLHRRTRDLEMDFFVLYSSAASLIGSGGQANYAAANSFLDALAYHRRACGRSAVSLNWGAWSGPGMAARPEVLERLKAQGVGTIPAEDGLDLLSAVLAGPAIPAQLGIFPARWTKFVEQLPIRLRTRLSGIVTVAAGSSEDEILQQLATASTAESQGILRGYLHRLLATVLGYENPDELNIQSRFFDLGMDSLTAVEFRNRLQEQLHIPLPSTLAFDYPDISTLALFLATVVAPQSTGTFAKAASQVEVKADQAEADERATLDGLTSDGISRLLFEELAEEGSHGR